MSLQESVVRAIWRHRVRVVVACCVLASYYGLVAAPVIAARNPSGGAEHWVRGLSDRAFQSATAQFAAYPFEYRQALLKRSTPAERAGTWRQILAEFCATYSHQFAVTAEREAALDSLEVSLTPVLFTGASPSMDDRVALKATTDRLVAAFDRPTIARLIGAPCAVSADGSALPLRERWARYARQHSSSGLVSAATLSWAVTLNAYPTECFCNVFWSDWCSGTCIVPDDGCITSNYGCGTYGLYQCNGQCASAPQG
jgi:hypothetical protein